MEQKVAALGRRGFLATPGALTAPRIAQGQDWQVLKFVPQGDLGTLEPVWFGAANVLNHRMMVFDALAELPSGDVPKSPV
jgi:hypothetical protein